MVPLRVILGFIMGLYWEIMEKKMETTIMGYIWRIWVAVKIMVPFWVPYIRCRTIKRDPEGP